MSAAPAGNASVMAGGEVIGVRAYSAALDWTSRVPCHSKTLFKRKAAEYARTPYASRIRPRWNQFGGL